MAAKKATKAGKGRAKKVEVKDLEAKKGPKGGFCDDMTLADFRGPARKNMLGDTATHEVGH